MGLAWRETPRELIRSLRRRGQDPERVSDVQTAWEAFCALLALPVEGLEPDGDADGFIVQWGRYSWDDGLPSLNFTRQLSVDVRETWTETEWYQPQCWQVRLDLVFADAPELADLARLAVQSTDFDFSPPGAEREHSISEAEWEVRQYPTLSALWASKPLRSKVGLERAD